MALILWIIQSFFSALWMVMSKKVLENREVWNNFQTFFSRTAHMLLLLSFFLLGFITLNFDLTLISPQDWLLFLWATGALYFTYYLRREAYANEKVSVLQPFAMLFQVFPVIFAFIFISSRDTALITFLMALTASALVIIPAIDWKNFKINKYSLMVLLSSTIKSAQLFVIIYMITKVTPATLYFIESIIVVLVSLFLMGTKKELGDFKKIEKGYFWLLFSTNSVWIISILLSLSMYANFGVVITSMISLLYLGFLYLLSFFILKDKASKKDLLISFWVAVCVITGIYFK